MNEEHDWGIITLTDKDLISLKNAIYKEEERRKNGKVKTAFEAFEKAAINLDKTFDDYYHMGDDDYTMKDIIGAIKYSILRAGYDI